MRPSYRASYPAAKALHRLRAGSLLRVLGALCASVVLVAVVLPFPGGAQEAEEILAYDVRVEVGVGGELTVTESIRVRALGNEIRRGIYRDFPTRFPREPAGEIVAPFEVLTVTRDGGPESYSVERIMGEGGRGGVRVRIGDADVFLDPGLYTYTLRYRTARWVQFGAERDRLDWNVTGNGWSFPILQASAVVVLPARVPEGEVGLAAWTGPESSTDQEASWRWDADTSEAYFETTAPLGSREGLTIRVEVPAGVIPPPTGQQESEWKRLDRGGIWDAGIAIALVLGLYLVMWVQMGRDPEPGPLVVRYEPPKGFSPAALGFLEERGHDPSQFTAAVVSLAVKGAATIEKQGRKWTIRATGEVPDTLTAGERALHAKLLGPSGAVTLDGKPEPKVRKAAKALRERIGREIEKEYLVLNRRWFAVGLAVSLLAFGSLAWRYRLDVSPEIWFLGLWLSFWTMGVGTLLYRVVQSWKLVFSGNVIATVGAVFSTLFAVPFVAAEIFVGFLLYQGAPQHLVMGAVVIGGLNVLFYHLLERPTMKGRGVLDHLAGFREYLGATDQDVFDRLQPPDRSLELFERFLPYAIALGVQNRWADRFEGALIPADTEAATAGHVPMTWYSGGSGMDVGGLSSSLGTAFSSSLSSASAAPSSSGGGSGGGGSSGGGGGGGGGGGW